jgi:hypothetical protein
MTDKVVSLKYGIPIAAPGTPVPELIEDLESLLEKARAGEINAIAYGVRYSDDLTSYRWVGVITRALIGALELAKLGMCQAEINAKD